MTYHYTTKSRGVDVIAEATDSSVVSAKQLRLMLAIVAGFVPFLIYALTATSIAHWFDTGEFVAVASDLGISHPPGHPLSSITFGLASFIPVGPLAFRVSLVCALLVASATGVLFLCFERSLFLGGISVERIRLGTALFSAWWIAGTIAWWMQAVRPEVYALQALLLVALSERLISYQMLVKPEQLFAAAFLFGLSLSNHHFLALLMFPAIAPFALHAWRRQHRSVFYKLIAWTFAGIATYVFLPLRSISHPYLNLGSPTSLSNFWWTITARAFQKSITHETQQPFFERFADVFIAISESLHIYVVMITIIGVYAAFRVQRSRAIAIFWILILVSFGFGRIVLGFVRGNPDALGYMMMCFAAIGFFVAFFFAQGLELLHARAPRPLRVNIGIAAMLLSVLAMFQFSRNWDDASLAQFSDGDYIDTAIARDLPYRSIVLVYRPDTLFRYWGNYAEESVRSDVTVIPMPLLHYPGLIDELASNTPELKKLLAARLVSGDINLGELQSLSQLRPVFVELDLRVPRNVWSGLAPNGIFHQVIGARTTADEERFGARQQAAFWSRLYGQIGEPKDKSTRAYLLWSHYMDALYFAHFGDLQSAKNAVAMGRRLNDSAVQLVALQAALQRAKGKIDIEPFVVGGR